MAKFRKKLNWKGIGAIVLTVVVVFGAVAGLTALFGKQTKTIGASAFALGDINTETGAYEESTTAIYTEDAFSCQGLRVEQDFKGNGVYQVFFYDSNGELLGKTGELTGTYESDFPGADSARVVYRPDSDNQKDFRIRFYEVGSYAKQLTITVDKEQTEYKTSTNLYVLGKSGYRFEATNINEDVQDASFATSEAIIVSEEYEYYQIYVCPDKFSSDNVVVAFGDADGKAIKLDNKGKTVEGIAYTFEGDDMKAECWYTVLVEAPVGAEVLRVYSPIDAQIRIYGVVED